MKKVIAGILVFCLAICFAACNKEQNGGWSEDAYIKVFFANGESETLALDKLSAMVSEDTKTYDSKYARNKMEMVAKVTKVELDYEMLGFVRVTFEGPWWCYIRKGTPVIDELERGQTVKVTGTLTLEDWTIYGAEITVLK